MEKRKNLREREKTRCHWGSGYFISVNQIVMTTVGYL